MKGVVSASVVSVALIAALPAYASTHYDTQVYHRTIPENRSATRVHTVYRSHEVPDITHVRIVTRVHPVHHINDVDRYEHYTLRKDENTFATRHHVAPARVEHDYRTAYVGSPAAPREHYVTRYRDVNRNDYSTRVRLHPVADIDRHIHRHIAEVTEQPIVHEHDVTRVVMDNHYVPRVAYEAGPTVMASARNIVTHNNEVAYLGNYRGNHRHMAYRGRGNNRLAYSG